MSPNSTTAPSFGPRHLDLPRRADVDRVAMGIAFVRRSLGDWQVERNEDAAVDAVLVAAELLSNAERHGGGTLWLELERHAGALRIAVHDASPSPPAPVLPHLAERAGGHGLFIIDRVATAWGWESEPPGKAVWAELPLPARPDA
ncbi:ATP-binding protein [Streptacidiphilus anmyonensis]|uniref:ATP-binding protein n=1 Tax=Streptacidiphilus anmyonensis TaxID=405782 RepID=UPI00069371DA|nr:ATP-binding protein [Streptacidiphilus anmyonensis]